MLPQEVAIQLQRFVLIAKTHQAFVTSCKTGELLVGAVGGKMATRQSFGGNPSNSVGFVDQATKRADSAFSSFKKQNRAMFVLTDALSGQLCFLQLKQLRDSAL